MQDCVMNYKLLVLMSDPMLIRNAHDVDVMDQGMTKKIVAVDYEDVLGSVEEILVELDESIDSLWESMDG